MEQQGQPQNTGGSGGTGLAPNVASLLCYLCTWVTGLIFILIEKDNKDVKFHAWQALFLGIAVFAAYIVIMVIGFIPYVGMIAIVLNLVVWVGFLVVWIMAMVKAYQGQRWVIPVIGPMAEQQANK
ncbi:MAG: DUF4870 domain-containing protein [Deltaproteobacteria bacterium]|nr:DUF4870 domain-containing protein [Deltaproteobacteria bacterium]